MKKIPQKKVVNENAKCKKLLTQNIEKIWDTMKRPNLKTIRINGEDSQFKEPENIFNIIIEENFPNLKKKDGYKHTRSLQKNK